VGGYAELMTELHGIGWYAMPRGSPQTARLLLFCFFLDSGRTQQLGMDLLIEGFPFHA
jgi:hypothetical protein